MKTFEAVRSSRVAALKTGVAVAGIALSLAMPGAALAADEDKDEIVVTGTLVRGLEAPTGTNVVGVNEEAIQSSGATTVTELLTDVPQFGSFNSIQTLSGGGNFVTTNRPNLRSLPGFTTTGTSATLLIVDGHRVVGMGIASTTPDADFIPPGIIERVEIVPDGGSAIYGSDAVAGVVNFITKKRFSGVNVDARYGFGKNYHTFDANATIGTQWDTGGIWISYNYAENDAIKGRDRSYNFTPPSRLDGVQILDTECFKPNLRVAAFPGGPTTLYSALSPTAANTANLCDQSDAADMYPKQQRHSVYVGLNQELAPWLELDVKAFYYTKKTLFTINEFFSTVNLGPSFLAPFGFTTSPFNVNLTGSPAETKAVNFVLAPENTSDQRVKLDTWGIRPTFTAQINDNWRARLTAGYSESDNLQRTERIVPTQLLVPLVSSGAFNPFNPGSASAATVAALTNWETYGQADQTQLDFRLVIDGDLIELPAGAVKLAVGAEYLRETYDSRKGDTVPANFMNLPRFEQTRKVTSVFGELVVPVFGGNGGPSLTVSAAGRYDDYSDFGDTFNPKLGATFKPVDWVSLRGSWGKSFVAPSLADSFVADPTGLNWIDGATLNFIAPPAVLAANGFPAVGPGQKIIFLLGAQPGLEPQKSKNWSIGADIEPPFAPGLRLSVTYYNLVYDNIISLVPFINQNLFFSTFAGAPGARDGSFFLNPTQAEIDTVVGQAGSIVGAACAPQPTCVYGIQDVRKRNQLGFKQDGIDLSINYRTQTSFGGIDFSLSGVHVLNRKNQAKSGLPFVSDLEFSDLSLRTQIGADIGNFRAQATWNYSNGYSLAIPVGLNGQTSIGDFSTFDLFFKYEFDQEGPLNDLAFTVTANNVFNQGPPVYTGGDIVRNQRGFRNGNTLGRVIQIGISKKFGGL